MRACAKRLGVRMSPHKHERSALARLRRSEDGVAAVEFSLLAPILFFACLATIDLGMALGERMTIDHVLRAGANLAMADPGTAAVQDALETTAKKNFTVTKVEPGDGQATSSSADSIYFEVEKFFACSDEPSSPVTNPADCSADYYTYYRLDAVKTYAAMILPDISFNPRIQVQIR
jgi:pilus assembly protein CpaE